VIYYATPFNGASYLVFVEFESPAMSKAAITAPNERCSAAYSVNKFLAAYQNKL